MRIAQFIDTTNLGGAEVVVAQLCKLCTRFGHTPVVFHFGNRYLDEFCQKRGIESEILDQRYLHKKLVLTPFFALYLAQRLKSRRIDILHSHLLGPAFSGALATSMSRTKSVCTFHDSYSILESRINRQMARVAISLTDQPVFVCRQMQDVYTESLATTNLAGEVVYNSVPIPDIEKADELLGELEIDRNSFVIVCVGRLVPLKRMRQLVAAFLDDDETKDSVLLIVGDGEEMRSIRSVVDKSCRSDSVRLLGERGDVDAILSIANLYASYSSTEGFSRSIMEAMAMGVPVLCTRVGGNEELVEEGVTGFLVDKDDLSGLIRTMNKLSRDRSSASEKGKAARDSVRLRYSESQFWNSHSRIYESIVGTR